jgi:hypothetical protein
MTVQLKRNDTKDIITYTITNLDETPVNLTGATVKFVMGKGKTLITNAAATIVNAAAGTVSYTLTENDTLVSDTFNAEFEVIYSNGKEKTFPTNGYIQVKIEANVDKDKSTYIEDQIAYRVSDIQVLKNSIQTQLDQFAQGATNAETSQARVEADGTTNTTLKARLDKKEAEFKTFKADTTTQLAQNMKKAFVSITDFGARAEAGFDNTQAFRDCIAFLKTNRKAMFVPDGEFEIHSGSKLLIDFDVFNIMGVNRYTSRIKFTHASGGFLYKKPVVTDWIYKPTFNNVTLTGNNVCQTLVEFQNPLSEMNANDCYFGESENYHIKFTEVNGVHFDKCDWANGVNGIYATNIGILELTGCNIFDHRKTITVTDSITTFKIDKTYFEQCDSILYATSTFTGILNFEFNSSTVLHNSGALAPFYFEKADYITSFKISNTSRFIFNSACQAVVAFVSPRTGQNCYLRFSDTFIEQTQAGFLTNVVSVPLGSQSWTTRVYLQNTTTPLTNANIVKGGLGIVHIMMVDLNVQFAKGVQVTDGHVYAGRIFYDTTDKKLKVTDENDIGKALMPIQAGTTAERPTNNYAGQVFFDLTLNKPVFWNGGGWVDSNGMVA